MDKKTCMQNKNIFDSIYLSQKTGQQTPQPTNQPTPNHLPNNHIYLTNTNNKINTNNHYLTTPQLPTTTKNITKNHNIFSYQYKTIGALSGPSLVS